MMANIIKVIGSLSISIFLMTLPLLCGLSYALDWYSFVKFILTVLNVMELFTIWNVFYQISEE